MCKAMKPARVIAFICIAVALSCCVVFAHPGRTDSNGGHNGPDGYHYHHGYDAHEHVNDTCPYDFDDKTNHDGNSGGTTDDGSNSSDVTAKQNDNNNSTYWDFAVYIVLLAPFAIYAIYKIIQKIALSVSFKRYLRKQIKEPNADEIIVGKPIIPIRKRLSNFFSSYTVIGIIILVVISLFGIEQSKVSDLKSELESAQWEIGNLQGKNDELETLNEDLASNNSYLEDELDYLYEDNADSKRSYTNLLEAAQGWQYKADFLDEHIALVTETGKKYHTYDCSFFQNCDSYWAYSIEAAKEEGYTPCANCH